METMQRELPLTGLMRIFEKLDVVKVLAKQLAQNDNSKQQVYLGASFDVLNELPFHNVTADTSLKDPTFKASLSFHWLTNDGRYEPASGAQLILYPQYPEVRLSGFLRGCAAAPAKHMRPVSSGERGEKNAWDGRVLFLGITSRNEIIAFLSLTGSAASADFERISSTGNLRRTGTLFSLPLLRSVNYTQIDLKRQLISELQAIANKGWLESVRLDKNGKIVPYTASNGGGYTLEANLGIRPNGRSEPDYLGWELKAISSDRVTLMTPEPNGGFYGDYGVQAFLRRYGRARGEDIYFTGTHRVGVTSITGHTLMLDGFDSSTNKINNVAGGIQLVLGGVVTARWSYSSLLEHWGRKHGQAAYLKYTKHQIANWFYQFSGPAMLGTGTDFTLFLAAMASGAVVYDPAPKIQGATGLKPTVKARSQFRITVKNLPNLYHHFETLVLIS